ncbi:hypothetical protein A2U01_0073515, partial [Trifolium medium]|nr:hypothetical protein [Trifolium medium]
KILSGTMDKEDEDDAAVCDIVHVLKEE